MWHYLDKLREKPEKEKKAIAFFVAIGITAVIFITWGTMTFSSFSKEIEVENDFKSIQNTASPFEAIGSQLETLNGQIGDFKEILKSTIEVEE